MGMMVLHGDLGQSMNSDGVFGGEVFGVEIMGDHGGLDGEEIFEMCNAIHERLQRLVVFQVADMVAHEGMALFTQAKSVLEMSAARENRLHEGLGHENGLRRIAARAADDQFAPVDRACN